MAGALAAHGAVSGVTPGGGAVGFLTVLAAGLGAMVTASPRARGPVPLIGLLAAGQLAGINVQLVGEAHMGQLPDGDLVRLLPAQSQHLPRRERHVFQHRQALEEGKVLEGARKAEPGGAVRSAEVPRISA